MYVGRHDTLSKDGIYACFAVKGRLRRYIASIVVQAVLEVSRGQHNMLNGSRSTLHLHSAISWVPNNIDCMGFLTLAFGGARSWDKWDK